MNEQRAKTGRTTSVVSRIVCSSITFVILLTLPALPASAADRFPTLADASRAGVLDPSVVQRLREGGQVEALVGFSYVSALQRGLADASTRAPEARSTAVLAAARPAFAAEKANVLGSSREGAGLVRDYGALPAALVRFDSEAALLTVVNDPDVLSVRANGRGQPGLAEGLQLIGQPQVAGAGFIGTGATIAMLDTGVDYTRAEFGSCPAPGGACKVVVAIDIARDDAATDDLEHGSWTAAIASALAPGAGIAALDVFDGEWVYDSDLLAALNWVLANQASYEIRVVNMSLARYGEYHTGDCAGSALDGPIAAVRAAGILPVAASGNQGTYGGTFSEGISFPACVPGVVSVGAVYEASGGPVSFRYSSINCVDPSYLPDQPTCFSQTAPSLDVLAPGAFITAGPWTGAVGTSASAPFVSGAAAVLAAASPGATVDQIQDLITGTGPLVTDTRPEPDVQTRRLDLSAAIQAFLDTRPSTTTGALSGFDTARGRYALYGSGDTVRFRGRLQPDQAGGFLTVIRESLVSGVWTTEEVQRLPIGNGGRAQLRIGSGLEPGVGYRIRAEFPGNATHAASVSAWSYLRITD